LGVVYTETIQKERTENLQDAVVACQNALKVYTREFVPEKWGGIQQNLGCAYDKAGQISDAIQYFWLALEVFTPMDYPLVCLKASGTLGNILFNAERWHEAIEAYRIAIQAVQQSRNWATTHPRRQEIMEEVIEVYFNMVRSCVKTQQIQQAVEFVERSKTRTLVELISTKASTNGETSQIETQVEKMGEKISRLAPHEIDTILLPELRHNFDELFAKAVTNEDLIDLLSDTQSLLNIQEFQFISLPEIQDILPDETTIILEWFITDETVFAFLIGKHFLWMTEPEDSKPLVQWANEYIITYDRNKKIWKNALVANLKHLSKILHLDEILFRIPKECDRLIVVPHRFMHLFPLHALPLADGTCFSDRLSQGISYAPSCQLLQMTQKSEKFDFSRLFAIQDPEQNLPFANSLVETISQHFQKEYCVLVREAATKDALNDTGNIEKMRLAHCVIFSGHGEFILNSPEQSCLKLANDTRLMMGEIFALDLSQCQLLILSACETGLTYPNSFSDEYMGLASGFIFAGCSNIVHTLWEVNSISTTLLIGELFKNILTELSTHQRLDVASALKKAQKWLRELSSERCQEILDNELKPQINHIIPMLPPRKQRIFSASLENAENQIRAQPYPFASPYYWAAFITTGI
jgi:CHAT domain-containing protein